MEGSQPNCGISQRRGEVAADYQYSVSLLYIHQTDIAKSSKCTVVADVMQNEEDTLTKVLKDIRTYTFSKWKGYEVVNEMLHSITTAVTIPPSLAR